MPLVFNVLRGAEGFGLIQARFCGAFVAEILRYIRFIVFSLRPKPNAQGSWRVFFALLCVLLVLATGTIQAVHSHPVGDISHADCALCVTAHVAVEVAQPPVALVVASVVSAVEVFDPSTRTKTFFTFALYTRPPPVDFVLA
ncbi:hypothetical protein RBB79_07105 [Tunturiibacter empetritectus]|uniref:Uncharacterized protein n=1 Tax=Tunturiibacter lichenicola TaxID=2051959 RepID=A0A852VIH8_9BACT|nr:hypothetical protein [Edaphobacter lichenicola]NYF89302.1 hypothetical protein [Edaphobacter lichenicola]